MQDPRLDAERTPEDQLASELVEFVAASHADELSDADALRLNELLENSQSAREMFLRLAQDTQSLRKWAMADLAQQGKLPIEPRAAGLGIAGLVAAKESTADQCSVGGNAPPDRFPVAPGAEAPADPLSPDGNKWFRGGSYTVVLFLGLSIIVGIAAAEGWLLYRGHSNVPIAQKHSTQSSLAQNHSNATADSSLSVTPVAYLTSANGCDWGRESLRSWEVGNSIASGSILSLHEGIAEFHLANNVHLSIEGPAALSITSPESVLLQYGKVTVRVPWNVDNFELIAGSCRMTACDAEFGVVVAAGQVEVHSFTGETQLLLSLFSGNFNGLDDLTGKDIDDGDVEGLDPIVVKEGQAIVLPSAGATSTNSIPADRNKFAAKMSMAGQLPVTSRYVDAVMASQPVGYWRFESIKDGQVKNEIQNGESLKVVGKVRLTGDTENRSLDLTTSNSGRGHLVSDLPIPLAGTDYSVEIWCKPSHFHRGTLVAMGFEDPQKPLKQILHHAFILQLMRNDDSWANVLRDLKPGSIRFLHRNPPTRDPRTGTSCYSDVLYHLRHWQHVVAVKQKADMRLYLNGVLVGTMEDPTEIAQDLRLMVGQAYFRRSDIQPSRTYSGQLDELAIYDRALKEAEILGHYRAMDFEPSQLPAENRSSGKSTDKSASRQPPAGWQRNVAGLGRVLETR